MECMPRDNVNNHFSIPFDNKTPLERCYESNIKFWLILRTWYSSPPPRPVHTCDFNVWKTLVAFLFRDDKSSDPYIFRNKWNIHVFSFIEHVNSVQAHFHFQFTIHHSFGDVRCYTHIDGWHVLRWHFGNLSDKIHYQFCRTVHEFRSTEKREFISI